MARKRTSGSDLVVSGGAAPARARRTPVSATREKHTAIPVEPPAPVVMENSAAPEQSAKEEIARLAYSYWAGRGYQGGSPEEDWLRAEREYQARCAVATA